MEKKVYQVNHTEELIINTIAGSSKAITVDKIELLDSPTSFTECSGEFKILDTGLYRAKIVFDALGEYLYRVKIDAETVMLFKVEIVEKTTNTLIRETLSTVIEKLDSEDLEDDKRIEDIYKLIKIINMKT